MEIEERRQIDDERRLDLEERQQIADERRLDLEERRLDLEKRRLDLEDKKWAGIDKLLTEGLKILKQINVIINFYLLFMHLRISRSSRRVSWPC